MAAALGLCLDAFGHPSGATAPHLPPSGRALPPKAYPSGRRSATEVLAVCAWLCRARFSGLRPAPKGWLGCRGRGCAPWGHVPAMMAQPPLFEPSTVGESPPLFPVGNTSQVQAALAAHSREFGTGPPGQLRKDNVGTRPTQHPVYQGGYRFRFATMPAAYPLFLSDLFTFIVRLFHSQRGAAQRHRQPAHILCACNGLLYGFGFLHLLQCNSISLRAHLTDNGG